MCIFIYVCVGIFIQYVCVYLTREAPYVLEVMRILRYQLLERVRVCIAALRTNITEYLCVYLFVLLVLCVFVLCVCVCSFILLEKLSMFSRR